MKINVGAISQFESIITYQSIITYLVRIRPLAKQNIREKLPFNRKNI